MKIPFFRYVLSGMLCLLTWMPLSAQQMDNGPLNGPAFGMSLGSGFTSGFNGGGLFTQSIAPHLQWSPAKRWNLIVGTVFSSSRLSGTPNLSPFFAPHAAVPAMPQNLLSTTVYASGAYLVNEKLTLTGTTWFEHNNMPQVFEPQMNPMAFGVNGKGMMIGLDYRLTENLHFGAEVRMSTGLNPYHPSYFNSRRATMLPGGW